MSAADVIARAGQMGVVLRVDGGALRYRGQRAAVAAIVSELEAHAPAIIALLSEHDQIPSATAAVESAQALLRRGEWLPEEAPCRFYIGQPIEAACRRCGSAWLEHFGMPGGAA